MTVSPITQALIQLARKAGDEILAIYARPELWAIEHKADQSPVTAADLAAHECLVQGLANILDVPVLSEESPASDLSERQSWSAYWLVDPLDGTKEFLARNGEFTVNIALIVNHQAVLGLIHQPTEDVSYFGVAGANPFSLALGAGLWRLGEFDRALAPVTTDLRAQKTLRVLASHRHGLEATQRMLKCLAEALRCEIQTVSLGSSLKFGYLAEGRADFYPRLGPTSEWDTAAGHALLRAVGGDLLAWPELCPLEYNLKTDLLNPHFIAFADGRINWRVYCSQF